MWGKTVTTNKETQLQFMTCKKLCWEETWIHANVLATYIYMHWLTSCHVGFSGSAWLSGLGERNTRDGRWWNVALQTIFRIMDSTGSGDRWGEAGTGQQQRSQWDNYAHQCFLKHIITHIYNRYLQYKTNIAVNFNFPHFLLWYKQNLIIPALMALT